VKNANAPHRLSRFDKICGTRLVSGHLVDGHVFLTNPFFSISTSPTKKKSAGEKQAGQSV
jgi:riboflavin synthase alpha subunit